VAEPITFAYFDSPFQVLYSALADRATTQAAVLLTSPGTIVALEKKGRTYLYWRVYDARGKRSDRYIGPKDAPETTAQLADVEGRIAEARYFADTSRALRKQGYAAADNSTALTLAALFNAGVFRHGAMLVGTHAFGALLNALGVRLPANYYTEDIDVARYRPIELATRPEGGILEILRASGLPFSEVPALDFRKPSTSFKVRGQPLKVDLLVPGDERYKSYPVPELGAHATGLPFFDYLLEASGEGIVLGRDHVVPVRIPTPARYCIHKLIVASLRAPTSAQKADKDLAQSAVLAAVLAEKFRGDLEEAVAPLAPKARKRAAQSARRAVDFLHARHGAGRDFLEELQNG
jgi:hypothetical protein